MCEIVVMFQWKKSHGQRISRKQCVVGLASTLFVKNYPERKPFNNASMMSRASLIEHGKMSRILFATNTVNRIEAWDGHEPVVRRFVYVVELWLNMMIPFICS
jgi:hypothetical protein